MKENISLYQYIENLQAKGHYWFLRTEAMQTLELSENAFKKAAHRLTVKNKLTRVRGDFYALLPLEYRASGCLPASWFIDAFMRYLNQPYYCGLLTAASLYGASHQQVMIFQVITNKQTRPITIGEVQIEFLYKKSIPTHFYQPIKTATGAMKVSTPEMTAFDLVRYINAAGQMNHVATVLSELAEQLNSTKLADLLENNDVSIVTAQRLGYLLECLKLSIDLNPLEQIVQLKRPTPRLLIPGNTQPILEYNQRWHIQANETVEPDEL